MISAQWKLVVPVILCSHRTHCSDADTVPYLEKLLVRWENRTEAVTIQCGKCNNGPCLGLLEVGGCACLAYWGMIGICQAHLGIGNAPGRGKCCSKVWWPIMHVYTFRALFLVLYNDCLIESSNDLWMSLIMFPVHRWRARAQRRFCSFSMIQKESAEARS